MAKKSKAKKSKATPKKTTSRPKKTVAPKSAKKTTKKVAKKVNKKVAKKTAKKVAKKSRAASPEKKSKTKAADSSMPVVGAMAPDFTLGTDQDGTLSLRSFQGQKNVVLYFYPKDDTPGCTIEACDFQKDLKEFQERNAVVLGVSPDTAASHGKFRKKYNLSFPLIVDDGAKLAKLYGVWVLKNNYGKEYMGIQRATFLIDKTGRVAASWPKVKVEGHAQEVLSVLSHIS